MPLAQLCIEVDGKPADAELIGWDVDGEAAAAAPSPDLLTAAKALLALWDGFDETGPVPLDDAIAALRAAAAKAEGR